MTDEIYEKAEYYKSEIDRCDYLLKLINSNDRSQMNKMHNDFAYLVDILPYKAAVNALQKRKERFERFFSEL